MVGDIGREAPQESRHSGGLRASSQTELHVSPPLSLMPLFLDCDRPLVLGEHSPKVGGLRGELLPQFVKQSVFVHLELLQRQLDELLSGGFCACNDGA